MKLSEFKRCDGPEPGSNYSFICESRLGDDCVCLNVISKDGSEKYEFITIDFLRSKVVVDFNELPPEVANDLRLYGRNANNLIPHVVVRGGVNPTEHVPVRQYPDWLQPAGIVNGVGGSLNAQEILSLGRLRENSVPSSLGRAVLFDRFTTAPPHPESWNRLDTAEDF